MKIELRDVAIPQPGPLEDPPEIPASMYETRCHNAYAAARCDWLVVYGDREHHANLTYLTGYDPRFEEAALLLGPGERRVLVVGNEGLGYASVARLRLDVVLFQSFSLMGQDRSIAPSLSAVLRAAGIQRGQRIGLAGWKYLEHEEADGEASTFFVPSVLVDRLRSLAGDPAAVVEATPVLMHPVHGLRSRNEVEQIAAFEWAATRMSLAVWRVVGGTHPGKTELDAVTNMGYAGEPMSCHVLFASGTRGIVGLRSPGARRIERGDRATVAIGYWGGLCCRAGLVTDDEPYFVSKIGVPHFRGLATWYHTVRLGVTGGMTFERVAEALAEGGLRSLLTPGHLTSLDEWVHTPVRPGSGERIASGMAFQCDIIPVPMPEGWVINCEDPVVFADAELRADLARRFPGVWSRIRARQEFMRQTLGLRIGDEILPLSAAPAVLPPLWLSSRVLVLS